MTTFETHDGRTTAWDASRNFLGSVRRTNCPRTNKATYHAKLSGSADQHEFSTLQQAKKWITKETSK